MQNMTTRTADLIDRVSEIAGAAVRWRRAGSGPTVIFLPGFPLTAETWDGVIEDLRHRYTCHSLDLVGLGESTSDSRDDFSSQGQARVFQALISTWDVQSYALVGNDTGGWIARELALLDEGRITHLILTNTEIPGHRPPWIPTYQRLAALPGYGWVLRQLLRSAAFCGSPMAFGGCFHERRRIEGEFRLRYIERLIDSASATDGALLFLRQMNFDRLDEFNELHSRIRIPTLFIWGEDDPTFPLARAREMADQFPHVAGFEVVGNAKLFFHEEYPGVLASLIDGFLSTSCESPARAPSPQSPQTACRPIIERE